MSSDSQKPWWELKAPKITIAGPEDDLMHVAANAQVPGDTVSETQFYGFKVPEAQINGICYIWHHPNLGVVTGGAWVWRGTNRHPLAAELFDMVTYQDDSCLAADMYDVTLENGYRSQVLEPLKKHRISYSDPLRGNSFDITFDAVTPAVLMKGGLHLEQGMHADGVLVLEGERFEVDSFVVRDRSWGAIRPERRSTLPPVAWTHCVLDEKLAFSYLAFDNPDRDPDWKGVLDLPLPDPFLDGWVWADGELHQLVAVSQRTEREFELLHPTGMEATMIDLTGRTYDLRAESCASGSWQTWMNFSATYCLARFECNGYSSFGDIQEVQSADYMRRFMGRKP